jgi:nucleotide-binding universal stress UspA family protein
MRDLNKRAPIVVGVDGSAASQDALDWAVSEATATQQPLLIVHALNAPWTGQPTSHRTANQPRTGEADEGDRATPKTVLAQATMRARSLAPELQIISTAVVDATAPALLHHAQGAELLVIGSHGPGDREGRLEGSVSLAMAARAPCPVVVVPARQAHRSAAAAERIVVLSDGSELSAAATRFAFQAAARRRIGLTVVRAWTPPFAGYRRLVLGLSQLVEEQRRTLLATLSADRHQFPEVEVELKLVRDKHNHHGRTLVEESANATLVVLGCHGHGRFVGLHSDAVCQSVLEHAHCPVAVVKVQPTAASVPVPAGVQPGAVGLEPAVRDEVGARSGEGVLAIDRTGQRHAQSDGRFLVR